MGKAARKLSGAALAEFNAKHPRGPGGRFVKAGAAASAPSVPAAPAPGRARARLGLAAKVDMPTSLKTLRTKNSAPVSGDREAVDAILKPMTHAQLDQVAKEFGIIANAFGRTKDAKTRQIRESLVGARLDHDAIMRIDLSTRDIFEGAQPVDLRKPSTSLAPKPAAPSQRGRARAALSGDRPRNTAEGNDLAAMSNVLSRMRHDELRKEIMALQGAGSEGIAQAEARLSGMTMPQLRAFAESLGPTAKLPAKIAKGEAVRRIVDGTIGYRQRAEAVAPGVTARRTANALQAAAPSPAAQPKAGRARKALSDAPRPGTANLERLMGGRPQPGEFGGGPAAPRSLPRSGAQWDWKTIQEDNMTMHGDSASMNLAQRLQRAGREEDAQYVADMRYRISNPRGEHSPDDVEQMVADLKAMMAREPDPNLRAQYLNALEDIDAPSAPLPVLPSSTPPVLRRMVDEMNKIPNARRTGSFAGTRKDVSVVDRLAGIIRQVEAGDHDALRGWQMQMRDALHSLHESVDGAMQMWRLERLLDEPEIRSWVRSHYPKA